MKKLLLWVMALFLVAIPMVVATEHCPAALLCNRPWDRLLCAEDGGCGTSHICPREDYIVNWTMNPCVQYNLNHSTPIEITVVPMSYFISKSCAGLKYYYGQNVSTRLIFDYANVSGNQSDSGWSEWFYPSYQRTYNYTAVNFTANTELTALLMVKYDSNATWERRLINFTIAPEGDNDAQNVVYGDCLTTSYGSAENWQGNAFYVSGDFLGSTWTRSFIWLFITMVVVGGAWFGMSKVKGFGSIQTAMTLFIGILMLIIGAAARMTTWYLVGTIFTIIAAFVGIKIARYLTK